MQTNKLLFVSVGILIGIAIFFLATKLSFQEAYAAPVKSSESFANQDFIAIASLARSDNNILWLVDTKNRKLLLYEYYNESVIRLKCVRDIQYDIEVPNAVSIPDKNADPTPSDVKKVYEEYRKRLEKENPNK